MILLAWLWSQQKIKMWLILVTYSVFTFFDPIIFYFNPPSKLNEELFGCLCSTTWELNGNMATLSLCVCLAATNCLGSRMRTCPGVLSHCVVTYSCPMCKTIAAALKQNTVWAKRAQWSKMQRKTHFPYIFSLRGCSVFVLECIFITPLALIQLCFYDVYLYVLIIWTRMTHASCIHRFDKFPI